MSDIQDPEIRARREDEWLAVRCQLGERAAFDELVARWHGPLSTYIRRMTGSDDTAADVAQEVWICILRGIARLRDGGSLRAWLFGIARRALMDRLRGRYRQPSETELDAELPLIEDDSRQRHEDLQALEEELARLPSVEREVLTLFYLRDLSLADVASILGVPVGTVKSRLFRARKLLRTHIEARGART